jgi:hypothetical protein
MSPSVTSSRGALHHQVLLLDEGHGRLSTWPQHALLDHTLVLNLLRGLNMHYDPLQTWITQYVLFPSFHTICNGLILEELTKEA